MFRGKDADGRWWYGNLIQTSSKNEYYIHPQVNIFKNNGHINNGPLVMHRVQENSVGQCTEMKDVNGVEIYELDYVKRTAMQPGGKDFFGSVEYMDGSFWIVDCEGDAISLGTEIGELIVIGNVYEGIDEQ